MSAQNFGAYLTRAVEHFSDLLRKVLRWQAAVPSAEIFCFAEGLHRLVPVSVVRFEGVLRVLGGAEEGPDVAVGGQVVGEGAELVRGVFELAAEVAFQRVAHAVRGVGEDDGAGLRGTRRNGRRYRRAGRGC